MIRSVNNVSFCAILLLLTLIICKPNCTTYNLPGTWPSGVYSTFVISRPSFCRIEISKTTVTNNKTSTYVIEMGFDTIPKSAFLTAVGKENCLFCN